MTLNTTQYTFFQYLCLCTGATEIGQIIESPKPPYYCGDLEISVIDDTGKSHDLVANVFVNSARVKNLPKALQDSKYERLISNTIMEERDSIGGLDVCKECGSYNQIVKYGYPFCDAKSKHRRMTVKDTGRYSECVKCGSLHNLSPFISVDNFNLSTGFDASKMKVWDYKTRTLKP